MSNETKKYAGLESLRAFLDGCRTLFASITHKHTMSDITDYTVDSELSSESTNPVQNKIINAEFDALADAMSDLMVTINEKIDSATVSETYETKADAQLKYDEITGSKADWNQNDENAIDYIKNKTHGEILAESEVIIFDNKTVDFIKEPMMPNVSSSILEFSNSDLVVGQIYTVVWDGTTYENLVCFEDDNEGYKSLGSAENMLGETGVYPFFIQNIDDTELLFVTSDTSIFKHTVQVSTISKVVSVKQLDEKYIPDTIARKEYVDTNFALKSEIGNVDLSNYYTKEDVDNMEFITADDIDTICGTNIQIANEVMF